MILIYSMLNVNRILRYMHYYLPATFMKNIFSIHPIHIMGRTYLLLALCILCSLTLQAQRTRTLINFDWKFIRQPIADAAQPAYDDHSWQTVQLPHDASIAGPFVQDSLQADRQNGFLPRLQGWYRKVITLDDSQLAGKVFLEFEGIYRDAHVYVNGKHLAHQLNGYESFLVDITTAATPGKNVVAVQYDNTDMESSRWYNGEGIYRNVWLVTMHPTHIQWHGTYVTTPTITANKATIQLSTTVVNELADSATVTLTSVVQQPDQTLCASVTNTVPLAAHETYAYLQSTTLTHPTLWSLEHPERYKVISYLIVAGDTIDRYETPFGIRTIAFDRDHGFLLNGKKVLVKGVNLHHDLGPLGAAAFARGYARRLEGLQKLGCNAIRLSHNPHAPYILDWCDQHGMLVFDEAFDKWDDQFFGQGHAFADHWQASLEAFITRDRNHPCVFIWSVGNETRQQRDPKAEFGVPQLKAMRAFVHSLDPTRPVTCGLHPSRRSGAYRTPNYYREGPPEMEFYMDVVSTNYREEFWPMDRAHYPQLMFILSEAQVGNLGNEWFNFNHDTSIGLFYWGGTDYIGESFGWPATGWPNGIIDWNDHWKPFSYYIQSLYSDSAVTHVTTYDPHHETTQYWNEVNLRYLPMYDHWNWEGRDSVDVFTFSNGETVELFLNGQSLGTKTVPAPYHTHDIKAYTAAEYDPDHPINTGPALHQELAWRVPYQPGTLRVDSKENGVVVASHTLHTAGKAQRVTLTADRSTLHADGLDLAYITVTITDAHGIVVPNANQAVTFKVSGAGTLAGTANADVTSHESFTGATQTVFQGKALLVVRAKRTPGKMTIKATAKGLKGATLTLTTD